MAQAVFVMMNNYFHDLAVAFLFASSILAHVVLRYWPGKPSAAVYRVLGRQDEPPMTRFVAHQISTAHWYDISAARADLGYQPSVSIEQGLLLLEQSLQRSD